MGDEPLLLNEERLVRYDLTVRRFIATQEMTEHRRRTEKKLTVEINVYRSLQGGNDIKNLRGRQ